ncbi:electron transport complex subunit RsxC [Vibrio rarus]|uniref:electron transport complex subunit RsxC n=1 Tax=Vibrio rarus TaxID=413403 RepID=UPI0021C3B2C2|nr:electron transport complex subunit RsxC [Vibrio rarus]
MLSLIEKIRSGHLWEFPGGVHPPENKSQSLSSKIERSSIADELIIPIKQHIGKNGDIIVHVGDRVLKGQPLTQYHSSFSLPVHASTSGEIIAIEPRPSCHPSALPEMSIILKPDHQDTWMPHQGTPDYTQCNPEQLLDIIRQAGISGMGGAGFPTARKLQSGLGRVDILIINGAECEPYITADDMLMREYADEIMQGIDILKHILKPKLIIIGVEDNKPQAIAALNEAGADRDVIIRAVPTKYPSGASKQLIKILTNKEIPSNGYSADIGMTMLNVGSAFAVKRAVIDGEPLIERVVTLTGNSIQAAKNFWVPIGTPVSHLLEQGHFKPTKKQTIIIGGPMMGFALPQIQAPITKICNCVLAPGKREIAFDEHEMACIRCGQCAEVCPASLLPQQMLWYSKDHDLDKCEEYNLKDCIECGACAYVCPSNIPLVQYYRQSKAEIKARNAEQDAAERAKVRFEQRKQRLERDKLEREQKYKQAADKRRSQMKTADGDDAIAAAIERVKQKQSAGPKPAVAAAIARAKAKQALAQGDSAAEPDNSEMRQLREQRKQEARQKKALHNEQQAPLTTAASTKSDAVAAAIARAKAKKEQQASASATSPNSNSSKQDAVKAAIERAKAKKAAQTADTPLNTPDSNQTESADPKKAAVAAAVARAKARKQQQEQQGTTDAPSITPDSNQAQNDDPKKAAVAAAVARAKARKQQQEQHHTADAPSSTPDSNQAQNDDPKKAAVAAAVARAKARKQQQEQQRTADAPSSTPDSNQAQNDDPKKAAVSAAVARAKARKQQQEQQRTADAPSSTPDSNQTQNDDPKKAAVAAAVARAKARKQQQEQHHTADAPSNTPDSNQAQNDDPKKAAVAAAVARAKARKQQQEQQRTTDAPSNTPDSNQTASADPKKAAIAAAVARAKAKKMAQQAKSRDSKENN